MKNDLTKEQLEQPITVTLPLGVVLNITGTEDAVFVEHPRLADLRKNRPDIGERGLHGIYAGNARGYDGEPDGILEVLDEAPKAMAWDNAKKWAESIGGRLPTRKEQALLFANVPELFKEEAYWSCEQCAGAAGFAWCQYFGYGTQGLYDKDGELRARAVRRLPIPT